MTYMHPWLAQHVYKHIELLSLKAALMGITIETSDTNVFFICPAADRVGTSTFNSGKEPSEQQLDMTFERACRYMDHIRRQPDHSWSLE